jgi:hypothetical protein
MPGAEEFVAAVVAAQSWDDRVAEIRKIGDHVSRAQQRAVYAAVARAFYAPSLTYEFAEIAWPKHLTEQPLRDAYDRAARLTAGFTRVSDQELAAMLLEEPSTLQVLRLIVGFTHQEFAAATKAAAVPVGEGALKTMERGGRPREAERVSVSCAVTVNRLLGGELYSPRETGTVQTKLQKIDTHDGWDSVREVAREGVPYWALLHQRLFGGAFRQLADAGGRAVGEALEDAVADLLDSGGIDYVRTGSSSKDKREVAERFGLALDLVPDFVIHKGGALRAFLECKSISDGGTARDKASRFESYRAEANRRNGIPVIAVLNGKGWERASDALGPVVRDCEGRVFTPTTLHELLTVDPFPQLMAPR